MSVPILKRDDVNSRVGERGSVLAPLAVVLLVLLYGALFGWLSLAQYWAFESHALDLGNMAQAAWNTVHGHPFAFTNMRLPYQIEAWNTTSRLSFHVEALFPVISLVYLFGARPESLLILQTAALALGAVPTYLLARDVLRSGFLGVAFALAYLLIPTLEGMNLYEFHPVALATPLLIAAFLFAYHRRYLPYAFCALAAMGTKEEIGLVVAMYGVYIILFNRDREMGMASVLVGVGWSLFAALVIEHHFRHGATLSYVHTRYPYLVQGGRHGVRGVVYALSHPDWIGQYVLIGPKLSYLIRLLAPMAFLALLAPWLLLLGLPTFLINGLSADFHMYSGLGDNSAELVAVVTVSSIMGARNLLRILPAAPSLSRATLGTVLLVFALWDQRVWGFTPLGTRYHTPAAGTHTEVQQQFVTMIPASVPVSTQDQLDPHLASRRYLYLFEDTGRPPDPPSAPANYILLDASAPTYPLNSDELEGLAQQFIHRPGWGVAAGRDGLILIEKGAHARVLPQAFYTYALAGSSEPQYRLSGITAHGLTVLGYTARETDQSNHYIPDLSVTLYIRADRRPRANYQPVLFETEGDAVLQCSARPLGLAWLPTSRWTAGKVYRVYLNTLETAPGPPGTARLLVELIHTPTDLSALNCGRLWATRGRLHEIGKRALPF